MPSQYHWMMKVAEIASVRPPFVLHNVSGDIKIITKSGTLEPSNVGRLRPILGARLPGGISPEPLKYASWLRIPQLDWQLDKGSLSGLHHRLPDVSRLALAIED